MKPAIAVLGVGRMGSALVSAFLKQGYTVDIWNRTRAKCEPLAAQGARIAATVRDAVAAADLVVVNVSDYGASDALLRPDEVTQALRGKLLVQLTSGSPGQAREQATWAQQHGIPYLDGAIMGTPDFIGQPGGTLLYSGPSELFEQARPILLALGGNTQHVGSDVGHAAALDSALLVSMWGQMFGVLQGVAVCEAERIPLDTFLGYVKAFAPVVDGGVTDLVTRVQQRRFAADTATLATIEVHAGALRHLLELCKERGLHRAVPEAFDQLFQAALRTGHGQDDFAALTRFMR
ncbi:NAD(P)-dependent oxidoreductase [Corallococcus sp. CA047B]|uniref:NAD(P)-dependent oxidoreductase n=1 Tax=Corallococcus sp. CA047B TaxID=2316729 RepID=UPI000EA0644B|nr:NAD(P)-binding domain-containing protein [Corallococcus sp. CA047B]RKH08626.1 NAD(P)-dependent oxidoreductase [Corallococcus sp. CA047B]